MRVGDREAANKIRDNIGKVMKGRILCLVMMEAKRPPGKTNFNKLHPTRFWSPIPALQADASLTESMSEQRLQRLNEQLTAARKEAEASGGMGCQGLAMANHRCPCSCVGGRGRPMFWILVSCYPFIVRIYAFDPGALI